MEQQLREPLSPRRKWLLRVVSVLLGTVLAFLMLEVSLRVILVRHARTVDSVQGEIRRKWGKGLMLLHILRPSANASRVYELFPGASGTFCSKPLKVNEAGFRDKPRATAKPPGTFRIAFLGDSVAFGWGVRQEYRFSDLLESCLSNATPTSGTRYECLNFAVPGYNSMMELATLRECVTKYSPDMLVLTLVSNDDELPNFVRIKPRVWSPRTCFIREAIRDLQVGHSLGDTARTIAGGIVPPKGCFANKALCFRPELVPPEYRHLMGFENARRALREMASLARERHIPAVCLVEYERLEGLGSDAKTGKENYNTKWVQAAREAGFIISDPLADLQKCVQERHASQEYLWVSRKDHHPNATAHAILGRNLCETLLEHELLPDAKAWKARADKTLAGWTTIANNFAAAPDHNP